jgi:hypothetical protein
MDQLRLVVDLVWGLLPFFAAVAVILPLWGIASSLEVISQQLIVSNFYAQQETLFRKALVESQTSSKDEQPVLWPLRGRSPDPRGIKP